MDHQYYESRYYALLKENQELREEIQSLNFKLSKAKQLTQKYQNIIIELEQELKLQSLVRNRESLKERVKQDGSLSFENFFVLHKKDSKGEILYQFPESCSFSPSVLLDYAFASPSLSSEEFVFTVKSDAELLYCCCILDSPLCFCIVSYVPCFQVHFEVLSRYISLTVNSGTSTSYSERPSVPLDSEGEEVGLLEEYYYNCKPSAGHVSINLQSVPSIDINIEDLSMVDYEWTCPVLFNAVDFDDLFHLICAVMLEKTIVFVSSNADFAASCVLALTALMRPFRWQYLISAVVPKVFKDVLETPVPLVAGVLKKPRNLKKFAHIEWVFIDEKVVCVSDKNQPQLFAKNIKEFLRFAHSKVLGRHRNLSEEQRCALHKFVHDLRNFWLQIIACVPIVEEQEIDFSVVKNSVMAAVDQKDRAFVEPMIETQFFIKYVEELYENN